MNKFLNIYVESPTADKNKCSLEALPSAAKDKNLRRARITHLMMKHDTKKSKELKQEMISTSEEDQSSNWLKHFDKNSFCVVLTATILVHLSSALRIDFQIHTQI